jgi:hypothetical protein
MDRMEHIRGKLLDGDAVVLEPIEGYLGSISVAKGKRKLWFGCLELPVEDRKRVASGVCYKLLLSDGRSGDLYVDVHDSNVPGKCTAEFQLIGGIKDRLGARAKRPWSYFLHYMWR